MQKIFRIFLIALLWSGAVFAQTLDKRVGLGIQNEQKQFGEVKVKLESGLAPLTQRFSEIEDLLKQGKSQAALEKFRTMGVEFGDLEKFIEEQPYYREIRSSLVANRQDVAAAAKALAAGQNKFALQRLKSAYTRSQAILRGGVLQIISSEISVRQAGSEIRRQDYRSAELLLDQAIEDLSSVLQDSRIDSKSLNKLKNQIILTKQQVILGKLKDEKALNGLYYDYSNARSNSLGSYYDIWNKTDAPWRNNY